MTVIEKAYAKINLFLDVTGKRDDGFHNISSIMHSVDLCDIISITLEPSNVTNINLTATVSDIPTDRDNLVYKAVEVYLNHYCINANVNIHIEKHIPIGAGLGGGSTDAAAALRALNKIFSKASTDQLVEIASSIGSDVPFCIDGGCAICTGRGEKIQKFDYNFSRDYRYIVIAIGDSRVSTPRAYSMLDEKYGDFKAYNKDKDFLDIRTIPAYNIFESVIKNNEIDKIRKIMLKNRAARVLMSGSGPSVFGGFKNIFAASIAAKELKKQGYSAYKCRLK